MNFIKSNFSYNLSILYIFLIKSINTFIIKNSSIEKMNIENILLKKKQKIKIKTQKMIH